MPLSDADKTRARKHLGYPDVNPSFGFFFGDPVATQQSWTFEEGVSHLRDTAIPEVVKLLNRLDRIECLMEQASEMRFAEKTAAGTVPNQEAGDDLESDFRRWAFRLCDLLNCIPNPHAVRFHVPRSVGNVRVR